MIKEFLSQMKATQPIEFKSYQNIVEHQLTLTKLFDGYVDLLRSNQSFPNNEVNKLVTLMWRLIGNKHIPTALDPSGSLPALSFAVIGSDDGLEQHGVVLIPRNFITITAHNPEMVIGGFAFVASQCRDYYVGKIPAESPQDLEEARARSIAFEVEALKTLEELAVEANVPIDIPAFQKERFKLYPEGLASLKKGINYLTPDYVGLGKQPFQPTQN